MSTVRSVHVAGQSNGAALAIVYTGDGFGVAAVALSLTTNIFSTSLIGFKAWYYSPISDRCSHSSYLTVHRLIQAA